MVGLDGLREEDRVPPLAALWTSRIALFSLALLLVALFLHRLFSLQTGAMLNLVKLTFLGAAVALVMAIIAAIQIWRFGNPGAARVVVGSFVAIGLLAWPLIELPTIRQLPEINDLTTDTDNPPRFAKLSGMRPPDANSAAYPGAAFAKQQKQAYPDLKTVLINRSAQETFEIAAESLRRQRMTIVNQQLPDPETGVPGLIEAVDRTLIMGFYDDVAVRIVGDRHVSRLDVRSASRYGSHDLGRNAERIRSLLKEVVGRLEATVPSREP